LQRTELDLELLLAKEYQVLVTVAALEE